jgi:O-antigen ligase
LDALAAILLVGNLTMGRSFAHLGVPPLYVNELSLALFLLARIGSWPAEWLGAMMRPGPLTALTWSITLSGIYGLIQCARGIDAGYDRTVALQDLLFHFYPLFIFLGLWVSAGHKDFLARILLPLAWVHGIYGIAYMAVLHDIGSDNLEPGQAGWFGDPIGSAIILLGILSLEAPLRRVWLPALLNLGVLLALQVRAELLALAVGFVLWSFLSRQLPRALGIGLVCLILFVIVTILDIRIESSGTRGGEISARALIGKALAPVAPETAKAYKRDADDDADTAAWRTGWWGAIWDKVHRTPAHALFGLGYGYPIWDLHPQGLVFNLRTPHNAFIYALGHTGWIGVLIFAALQLALGRLLWRAYRLSRQPFGVCVWLMLLAKGIFENFFETPFNAIPFYLITGMALGQLFGPADAAYDPGQIKADETLAIL